MIVTYSLTDKKKKSISLQRTVTVQSIALLFLCKVQNPVCFKCWLVNRFHNEKKSLATTTTILL